MSGKTLNLLALLCLAVPCVAQTVPTTEAKALDGSPIIFPKRDSHKPLVLMIGFSHKSSDDFDGWNKQLLSTYMSDPRIDVYELADLQGVPTFVRSMILHGMRREIHGQEQAHFAPIFNGENEWKSLVNYSDSEVTYLVLADGTGKVVWQTRGKTNDEKGAELKAALAKLIVPSEKP